MAFVFIYHINNSPVWWSGARVIMTNSAFNYVRMEVKAELSNILYKCLKLTSSTILGRKTLEKIFRNLHKHWYPGSI